MVIPVQKDERLLAQYNEHGISELWQLGENEQERPTTSHSVMFDKAGTVQFYLLRVKQE